MGKIELLDTSLQHLREEAATQNKLYVSSKIALYHALVGTYLWWREASQTPGYLDQRFEQEGIRFRSQLNRPNFNPVIRLVFKMQQHLQNVQISNWGSALNAIDDEYQRNAHIYKHRDAISELVNWIDENGGLAGICGRKKEEIEEYGYDYKEPAGKKSSTRTDLSKSKKKREIIELKKISISRSSSPLTFDVGEVGSDQDDLVVLLAKATGNGSKLRLIGSTAQQTLVDQAVMQIGEVDFLHIPENLRMLCEAVKLNAIPRALQEYGARSKFYDQSKIIVDDDGKKYRSKEQPRLVFRKDGSILVSKSTSAASLVTRYKPTKKTQFDQDYWLRGTDRYWIETALINEGEIALYDAKPKSGLGKQTDPEIQANKKIELHSALTQHTRNLYFYDFSRIDDETMFQPDIIDERIDFDWLIEGKASFFRRLYDQHFNGWQHRVKHRVAAAGNKAVAFEVNEHGVVCEKKWSKADNCFMQTGSRYMTSFGDDVVSQGSGRTVFAPTDIIASLEMISKTQIKNDKVAMKGNEHLIQITFANELATIEVFIPSCSITGKRNPKYFTRFLPND